MTALFWVGGTGTWDNSSTTHWSTSSGGSSGAGPPVAGDDVTFDASSGGGTVTTNATLAMNTLTITAFTGTLTFATNNNNITLTSNFDNNGTSATLNMGNGTWTLSGANSFFRIASGATFNANSSTLSFTAAGAVGTFRRLFSNGKTFSTLNIAGNANGVFVFTGNATIGTLTVSAPNRMDVAGGSTLTITNAATFTGTSSNQIYLTSDNIVGGSAAATWSSANNLTATWCAFSFMTFSGGGTFSATNSFDLGGNSGITITAPSTGGGAVGVIGS